MPSSPAQTLHLLPERAGIWPRTPPTLVVADVHWGKDETFRAAGIPIPVGPVRADLACLDTALRRTGAERLLVLGDLWHARSRASPRITLRRAAGLARRPTRRWSSTGVSSRWNHNRRAGHPPPDLNIVCRDEPVVESPFMFRHVPGPSADGYVLAGHVHPAVILRGEGRQRARLPLLLVRGGGRAAPGVRRVHRLGRSPSPSPGTGCSSWPATR